MNRRILKKLSSKAAKLLIGVYIKEAGAITQDAIFLDDCDEDLDTYGILCIAHSPMHEYPMECEVSTCWDILYDLYFTQHIKGHDESFHWVMDSSYNPATPNILNWAKSYKEANTNE